jgi:hypothetical protein
MSSRFAATQHAAASPPKNAATPVAAPPAVRRDETAGEVAPRSAFAIFGDPLWGMAIATIILFAIFAALVAFA